jgi:hypothetical protein
MLSHQGVTCSFTITLTCIQQNASDIAFSSTSTFNLRMEKHSSNGSPHQHCSMLSATCYKCAVLGLYTLLASVATCGPCIAIGSCAWCCGSCSSHHCRYG